MNSAKAVATPSPMPKVLIMIHAGRGKCSIERSEPLNGVFGSHYERNGSYSRSEEELR